MFDTRENSQAIVDLLNSMFQADEDATRGLIGHRVPCNNELVRHPTIIVGDVAADGRSDVGVIGVINGLFPGTSHRVASAHDDDGVLVGFKVVSVKD